jgi:hypothetical protein
MEADALLLPGNVDNDPPDTEFHNTDRDNFVFNGNANGNKRKAEEYKVEGPLTPSIFSESPAKKLKSVTFSAMVQFIPELPSTYEDGNDVLCPEDDFAGFYAEEMVEETVRQIDHEKLADADTTKRVDVPYLDFKLPVAPWVEHKKQKYDHGTEKTELYAQMRFMLHVKRKLIKSVETWHGVSKLERDFRWDPMPAHSSKVIIEEKLHGEENISKLLADLAGGEFVTSSSGIWKREGLQVLEEDEFDDEQLETAEPEAPDTTCDLGALARKRKLEIEETDIHTGRGSEMFPTRPFPRNGGPELMRGVNESPHWSSGPPKELVPSKSQTKHHSSAHEKKRATTTKNQSKIEESNSSAMFGGRYSSTTHALENFLVVQGMAIGPPKANQHNVSASTSAHFHTSKLPIRSREPTAEEPSSSPRGNVEHEHTTNPPPPQAQLPSVPAVLPPCSFIISSALLQQRNLSKQIEQLYPSAEFVTRDYTLVHSPAGEADILLSPSTGLIITTLQQVKQRALPGQPDRSPVKERIIGLQHRYERLVIMVTEGLNREMEEHGYGRPVDARDQEAITAFEHFASQMEGEMLVRYVPGGEQFLARSIIKEMAAYGLPHGSQDIGDIKPLPDETNVSHPPQSPVHSHYPIAPLPQ